MFEEEYRLNYFEKEGFTRKKCQECGSYFWTLDEDMETCQDAPCIEFDFIGNPPSDRTLSVKEMRQFFLNFFVEREHTKVDRYPVVARWRDDVLLVHASIYDFQPHVTSGLVEPPANPLAVSQTCVRLPDVDEVGRTGKHQTAFEMLGHHSFNSSEDPVYWKEETVKYCHEMLKEMGISEDLIAYKEYPWIGGGNAGPALEVNIQGLEVATLVFMNMEKDPQGDVDLDGDLYSPLDLNVVDTGYGLERLAWITEGSPTIYDSVYPQMVKTIISSLDMEHPLEDESYKKMLEEYTNLAGTSDRDFEDEELMDELMDRISGYDVEMEREEIVEKLSELRSVYILADHSYAIALMLSDGVVPSNVEEGYLARMMIRRALRQIDNLGRNHSLSSLVEKQMDIHSDIIDQDKKELVFDMLENEIDKYYSTLEKGKRMVKRELKELEEGEQLSIDELIEFYDTHGIHPTIVKDIAGDFDVDIEIPENFNAILAERHETVEKEGQKEEETKETYDLPDTEPLYYDNPTAKTFEGVVLHSEDDEVILDQTLFYPEGGGQPSDHGHLLTEEESFPVKHVRKENGIIIHEIEGEIPEGEVVEGKIDWKRRMALTRHHTATHIIMSAARDLLGDHIWQRGAQKGVESARLDLSHYKRISREEIKEIERRANEIVLEDIPVEKEELTRDEAEKRFGFELYQGGVPQSDVIRVVHISDVQDYDAQACGGTHVERTSEVGAIKILNTQRIQDGVERLTYSAGLATVEKVQHQEDLLLDTASKFSVDTEKLPDTAERFFNEWKERGKELEKLKKYKSIAIAEELVPGEEEKGVEFIVDTVNMETKEMISTAERLTSEEDRVVLLASEGEKVQLVFSRSDDLNVDMSEVLREAAKEINGGGGGSPKTAQGGGSKAEGRDNALERAKSLVIEKLD
ncbi:MAG: alanine--tRNA ligase [Candidatus Thermoplasmatota archaeon]|nr:alanine--tRNA ligase [Candidatus Thermoplasmatota archaeon]